jgi:DNA-binding GntR family transcriptional regulator
MRLVALCGERDAAAVGAAVAEHIVRGRDALLEQLNRAGS